MVPSTAQTITSIGFIGSGRLAERIARKLVKNVVPQQKFCYKTQQLVSTLLASDPLQERRDVFQQLGFQTTEKNQDIISECDLVFIGTTAREALAKERHTTARNQHGKNTLFVSLMGDLPANQIEHYLCPGAKVIRMMPQNYLESKGLRVDTLPEKAWATTRNSHATAEDVERVMEIAGITSCVEGSKQEADLLAFNTHDLKTTKEMSSDDDDPYSNTDKQHFHDEFVLDGFIGRGQFAEVFKATHRVTGTVYAVKCVNVEDVSKDGIDTLLAEVAALRRLNHTNIIAHHGFYMEDDKYYLVLDHCDGGSIRRILDQGRLSEEQAKSMIKQLLQGIEHCHSMGQVHRDIKAENVLLVSDTYQVKLADFGLSKKLEPSTGHLQDTCGTPQYLSPEIVSGRTYGKPSDIWSAGILSYMLLSGRVPFDDAFDEVHLKQLIRLGAVMYHSTDWKDISEDAKDFVQCMLEVTPDSRPTATELLAHPWLARR